MGKFSEQLRKRLRLQAEPIPNWRKVGETFVLATKIIDLGPERTATEILAVRAKIGKQAEADFRAMFELFRAMSEKQLEAADRALKVLDECSKRMDQATKPRLVS